jgi:putative acetyltransferase
MYTLETQYDKVGSQVDQAFSYDLREFFQGKQAGNAASMQKTSIQCANMSGYRAGINFRSATAHEHDAIARITDLAFGGPAESSLVAALRAGGHVRPAHDMVALVDQQIVAHCVLSRVMLSRRSPSPITLEGLALAPVAVAPEYQRQGIGSRLISHAIQQARESTCPVIVVLGDPKLYSRFGFSTSLAARTLSGPYDGEHFMALELQAGVLDCPGDDRWRVEYSAPFAALA